LSLAARLGSVRALGKDCVQLRRKLIMNHLRVTILWAAILASLGAAVAGAAPLTAVASLPATLKQAAWVSLATPYASRDLPAYVITCCPDTVPLRPYAPLLWAREESDPLIAGQVVTQLSGPAISVLVDSLAADPSLSDSTFEAGGRWVLMVGALDSSG